MKLEFTILVFIIFIVVFYFIKRNKKNMVYVKANTPNNDKAVYLCRDLPDKHQAANLLAQIKANITTITTYLHTNKAQNKHKEYTTYIDQLYNRTKDVIMLENDGDYEYTSYSINKGEQLVFCLRSRNLVTETLHDINLIMYVVLHEISHIACPEVGHGELFKKIFAFITQTAIDIGLYRKIDFENNPVNYCGLLINDSII